MLVATAVAIITCLAVANATQTITTPNAAFISYSLAAGKDSAAITPATDKSVQVMGCCTTAGDTGVGQVSLLDSSTSIHFIEWVGLESPQTSTITNGDTAVAGTHIVYIDFFHNVDIQVASNDTIRIHNGSTSVRAGNVTLIW